MSPLPKLLPLAALAAVAGCGPRASHPTPVASTQSAITIPQILQQINSKISPQTFIYANAARAVLLKQQLDQGGAAMSPMDRTGAELEYASELNKAGKTQDCLDAYAEIEREISSDLPAPWQPSRAKLLRLEAVAYLRLAEQQNCCASNNAYSCLVPIVGPGRHTKRTGSENAIRCLSESLLLEPGNMEARWL